MKDVGAGGCEREKERTKRAERLATMKRWRQGKFSNGDLLRIVYYMKDGE